MYTSFVKVLNERCTLSKVALAVTVLLLGGGSGSNLDRSTDYDTWLLAVFLRPSKQLPGKYLKLIHHSLLHS
jgi:hypothetical protein